MVRFLSQRRYRGGRSQSLTGRIIRAHARLDPLADYLAVCHGLRTACAAGVVTAYSGEFQRHGLRRFDRYVERALGALEGRHRLSLVSRTFPCVPARDLPSTGNWVRRRR